MKLLRTDSANSDFALLVKDLDAFLAFIDGDEHAFYAQLNKTATLQHVLVAYDDDEQPVACGAIREHVPGIMEVKRMYTKPESRGKGFAKLVLTELENWSAELGYHTCVLETGHRQPEAIALYKKSGYLQVPNYGKYADVANSVCFKKNLHIDSAG